VNAQRSPLNQPVVTTSPLSAGPSPRRRPTKPLKVNVEGANALGPAVAFSSTALATSQSRALDSAIVNAAAAAVVSAGGLLMETPTGSIVNPLLASSQLSPSMLANMNFDGLEYLVMSPRDSARAPSVSAGAKFPVPPAIPPARDVVHSAPPAPGSRAGSVPPVHPPPPPRHNNAPTASPMIDLLKKRPASSPRQSSNVVVPYPSDMDLLTRHPSMRGVAVDDSRDSTPTNVPPPVLLGTRPTATERAFEAMQSSSPRNPAATTGSFQFYEASDVPMTGNQGQQEEKAATIDFGDIPSADDIDYDLLNSLDL
jgi:hypothetical protein